MVWVLDTNRSSPGSQGEKSLGEKHKQQCGQAWRRASHHLWDPLSMCVTFNYFIYVRNRCRVSSPSHPRSELRLGQAVAGHRNSIQDSQRSRETDDGARATASQGRHEQEAGPGSGVRTGS